MSLQPGAFQVLPKLEPFAEQACTAVSIRGVTEWECLR